MIIVKSDLSGDLRRFSLEDDANFETLSALLLQLYPAEQIHYKIKYKDDEGDWLSITSTTELREAVRITKAFAPPILRLSLEPCSGPVPTSVPSKTTSCSLNFPSGSPVVQPIRIQGRTFAPTQKVEPLGPVKVTQVDAEEKREVLEPEAPSVESAPQPPVRKNFGSVISALSDDTARTTLEGSFIVSASQKQLGASTAAMCNSFADNIKEFYSQLIFETTKKVDPGASALQTALDSLCTETANECEKLQKDLGVQTQEQLNIVRSALNSHDLIPTNELEKLVQHSITETHDLAASVLQKTRDQSLSFLEVMNKLHNETVSSVLREAGAETV